LGSGCGLIAITLCNLDCKNVIATDIEQVIDNTKYNLKQNVVTTNYEVFKLEWDNDDDISKINSCDILVCCELLYKEAPWGKLLNTILKLFKKNKDLEIIFAYKKRYMLQELFINELQKFCEIQYVPKSHYHEEFQLTDDFIIFNALLRNENISL
jgi:predicted nicotinamide N-methyase